MKLIQYITALSLTVILFNGCTDNFDTLNTRPDALAADDVDASKLGQVFAQAQFYSMYGEPGSFQIGENLFSDIYAQYFATTAQAFTSDRYIEVGSWINSGWNNFYGAAAPQLKFVEDFTAENELPIENAMAKIWRVQGYHRITDYWGPIIYTQFGNGQSRVDYDTQESIYKSFFLTLDSAVAVLKENIDVQGNLLANSDQVYNGDLRQWLAYANSLRLRLAMRVKYVEPALAQAEAEKAVADGVILTNDDNAMLTTTTNSRNPFWTITGWGEFRMSAAMESALVGYNDPRTGIYFNPAAGGDSDGDGSPYEGLRNGLPQVEMSAEQNAAHSDVGNPYLYNATDGTTPIRVISAAEVFFLRAEGALEGWNMGGTVQELYEEGIRMSLTEDRVSATVTDVANYIASTNTPAPVGDKWNTPPLSDIPVAFDAAGNKERQLQQIITQKWLALYPDGWEAWAELRRTGYPTLYPRLNSDNPDVPADAIFRRMTFVDGEFSNNAAAVEAAIQLPELQSRGGDRNNTRVWWDAK